MSKEDELASYYIGRRDDSEYRPEYHYNHYGDRGVVDLVEIAEDGSCADAFEFKSPSAVREATGANEILRQFNRQVEYLEKGSDLDVNNVTHVLVFYLSQDTHDHVMANIDTYSTVNGNVLLVEPDEGIVMPIVDNDLHYLNEETRAKYRGERNE